MADVFNIGISALISSQRQLSTTSHNIANVHTEGYSRQRTELVQRPPQAAGGSFFGSGVEVSAVNRITDQFLVTQLRTANTNAANATTMLNFASQLDDIVGDGTFTSSLEQFFSALQDANSNPASISSREVLLSAAQSFSARFNQLEARLSATARGINDSIEGTVNDINSIASAISDLNEDIVLALGRSQGEPPNDLLDQRELLVSDLAKLVGVETLQQEDGAINVFIGSGQLIVASESHIPLVTQPNPLNGTQLEVAVSSGSTTSIVSNLITNGELGAALSFRDDMLEPARNAVGRLAAVLATSFNAQHREGLDLNDELGGDVFRLGNARVNADPSNAGSISVAIDTANIGALGTSDYRLTHDGADFTLTDLSDGSSQTLAGAGPFTVDGMVINVTGAPAAGDVYLLQPTKELARDMSVLVSSARDFALARPNRTTAGATNIGAGVISDPTVLDITDANLLSSTQLVFNDPPTTFQINGVGPLVPYTDGGNIDMNGWRIQISGDPEPGDTFTVAANFGGAGDNGNGLVLADLQATKIADGATATYQEAFSQLIGSVGAKTQQTQLSRDALLVLQENAQSTRDSLSAVNLDEEAAQLLRFQQAYTAAAEVIATANETFDSLLSAVRS